MKNFLNMFNAETLKKNIGNIISRFPIPIFIVFIVTGLLLTILHGNFSNNINENIIRTVFSLIITFFLSLGFYISLENLYFSKIGKNVFQIIAIIFGGLFFFGFTNNIDNFENIIFFILTLAGIIGYLFFAPYIKNIILKNTNQSIFYTYFYKISVVFLISSILGGLLLALGIIGIATVFSLFDLDGIISSKIYEDWIIIALSFFPAIFALTQIPEKKSFNEDHFNENIFFSFLVKYIAIPFIYIYFIILYAYTLKVLSNFGNWPKGEVSWIVIGFSVFGYIIYIYSYIFEEKNKFINTFRKTFPYVVIPQIFMLFYAIYLRIVQYDITVNRYFITVFGIWLLVISIYYIFSRKKYLGIIPFILTIFTIIISVGPWSVYKLPEARQFSKLESNLIFAGILQDGKIIPLNNFDDIKQELSKNIYSEIEYLCDYSNCEKIKNLFSKQYNILLEKNEKLFNETKNKDLETYKDDEKMMKITKNKIFNEPEKWEIVNAITNEIKIKPYYENIEEKKQEYLRIYINGQQDIFPLQIDGYSKILKLVDYIIYNENIKEYATINFDKQTLEIIKDGIIVQELDIKEIFTKLYNNYKQNKNYEFSIIDLTFEIHDYKIIFDNINIKNPEYIGEELNTKGSYYNGYVLIK